MAEMNIIRSQWRVARWETAGEIRAREQMRGGWRDGDGDGNRQRRSKGEKVEMVGWILVRKRDGGMHGYVPHC